jgi:hypothetical protein
MSQKESLLMRLRWESPLVRAILIVAGGTLIAGFTALVMKYVR